MLLDLCDRAKFRVTGADRIRFLNGQLTNDINGLRPGAALYACALTAKGKLCADLFVSATEKGIYLDTETMLREPLATRLERYIIADDVMLEDVTVDFGLFHFIDPKLPLPSDSAETFVINSNRFGVPGIDLWFPASQASLICERSNEPVVDAEAAENLRIGQGIARWGHELSEDVIPNEADLDKRAISYTKGCYLGQEVISRIKSVGHVNRHLRGLLPSGNIVVEPGDKLVSGRGEGKAVGSITSVGRTESLDRVIALGYVRRGFDGPGSILQVLRNTTLIGAVEVRELPFTSA